MVTGCPGPLDVHRNATVTMPAGPATNGVFASRLITGSSAVIVSLRGELDVHAISRLRSALDRAELEGKNLVVVDLSNLDFIDSTGLAALVSCQDRLSCNFALIKGSHQIQRILRASGLESRFEFIDVADGRLQD